VLGGNIHNVVGRALNRQPWNVQRLGIYESVHCAPKEFAETVLIHVRSVEGCLTQILTGARVIIVLRQNRDLAHGRDRAEQSQHEHASLDQADNMFSHFRFLHEDRVSRPLLVGNVGGTKRWGRPWSPQSALPVRDRKSSQPIRNRKRPAQTRDMIGAFKTVKTDLPVAQRDALHRVLCNRTPSFPGPGSC
jgi:hypothetical protein